MHDEGGWSLAMTDKNRDNHSSSLPDNLLSNPWTQPKDPKSQEAREITRVGFQRPLEEPGIQRVSVNSFYSVGGGGAPANGS